MGCSALLFSSFNFSRQYAFQEDNRNANRIAVHIDNIGGSRGHARRTPLQDQIFSLLHTFSMKSANIRGPRPPLTGPCPPPPPT